MHQPWVRPHGVSRGQARVAFQFHGSLDLGIIVLRYVTLCNGRSRAVSRLLFHQRQRRAAPFVLGDRAELHALDLVVEHPERRCRF
jgi:hypothetical protein